MKDFLVITLHSGEPQFKQCSTSVEKQKKVTFEHKIISGLNAYDSARALHNLANDNKDKFRYLLKLDADMEIDSDLFLMNLKQLFEQYNNPDRLTLSLVDKIIDESILGIHSVNMQVLSDKQIITPEKRDNWLSEIDGHNIWVKDRKFLIFHCKNPSKEQKYIFGFNRGLKINLQGKMSPNYESLYLAIKKKKYGVMNGFYDALTKKNEKKFDRGLIVKRFSKSDGNQNNLSFDDLYLKRYGFLDLVKIKMKIYKSLFLKRLLLCL